MDLTFCKYLVFHEFRVCIITLAKYFELESIAGLFSASSFQVLRKSHEEKVADYCIIPNKFFS